MPYHIPTIIEKVGLDEKYFDLYSRLLQDRVILLDTVIDDDVASSIVGQLLFLDSVNHNPIKLYINSPGGSVTAGLAILDIIQHISSEVYTICIGEASSMGAFLLAMGDKRFSMQNSRIMIHQVSSGTQGQVADIKIQYEESKLLNDKLCKYLSEASKNTDFETMSKLMDRDNYMSAEEAKTLGLIDDIIKPTKKSKHK